MIKSLENRVILFKATTWKTIRRLMTAVILLAKSVFIPLGISAEMSAVDAAIPKKIYGSDTRALIISNEESGLLIKVASKTI